MFLRIAVVKKLAVCVFAVGLLPVYTHYARWSVFVEFIARYPCDRWFMGQLPVHLRERAMETVRLSACVSVFVVATFPYERSLCFTALLTQVAFC